MKLYLVAAMRPTPAQWNELGGVQRIVRLYLATWPPEKQKEQTLGQAFAQDYAMKLHLVDSGNENSLHYRLADGSAKANAMQLRILLSYWYYKDTDLDALFAKYFSEPYPEVFADSGAFSAMTQGVAITCAEYADWVKRWQHLFTTYANLDVIKNAEKTWDNQRRLEDMGITPIPAFHVLEDFKWLEQYAESYPYIALGVAGMQARRRAIMAWVTKCYRVVGNRSVFHGFALTSWEVMRTFPWYSVDSSSWGSGFRYGQVPLFDDRLGTFREARLGDYASCRAHSALIRQLGFDWRDFADRARNDRAKICAISALSYMRAERWLRKRHGEIRIPGRADAPAGLRSHLADANPARYGEAVQGATGRRLHLADTSNGINFGDADAGLKLYGGAGNIEGGDRPLANMSMTSRGLSRHYLDGEAEGIKLHLAGADGDSGRDLERQGALGLKIHLAEHSLDRGGGR